MAMSHLLTDKAFYALSTLTRQRKILEVRSLRSVFVLRMC